MLNPVRRTAGWLSGRLMLFLIVLAVLVLNIDREQLRQAYREVVDRQASAARLAALEEVHAKAREYIADKEAELDRRLSAEFQTLRPGSPEVAIQARIRALDEQASTLEGKLLTPARMTLAILEGSGLQGEIETRVRIRLIRHEASEWRRALKVMKEVGAGIEALQREVEAARTAMTAASAASTRKRDERIRHWNSRFPWFPVAQAKWNDRAVRLMHEDEALQRAYHTALHAFELKRDALNMAQAAGKIVPAAASVAEDSVLSELNSAIERVRTVSDTRSAIAGKLLTALWIVAGVTVSPVLLRSLWYWVFAPWAARRPIRFDTRPFLSEPSSRRISGVSLDIVLKDGEELLVHPEYLQSSTIASHTRTKALLSWRFPMASLATRMIGLTLIRGAAGRSFTVSSRTDPFSEVATIEIPENSAFILQPRFLVGLVQRTDRPIAIGRYWRFGLTAWITLQFRYLAFEGPGTLIVQGCRGVRLEPANAHRAVDQRATLGFSANLEYVPSRAETFVPYLLGARGLFNDGFRGDGLCAYEEMPYARGRSGITGRGLEGLTDAVMKIFGY